jgi:hypothetical protein
MVYLDPASASRVVPPRDIAIGNLPNGAMLLTATTDTIFNGRDPNHWAAALRIQAALAPLNERQNERPSGRFMTNEADQRVARDFIDRYEAAWARGAQAAS